MSKTTLDEILQQYGMDMYEFEIYDPSAEWDAEKYKAKQAILRWVADVVIGEDRHHEDEHSSKVTKMEQRQILAQHGYKGGE